MQIQYSSAIRGLQQASQLKVTWVGNFRIRNHFSGVIPKPESRTLCAHDAGFYIKYLLADSSPNTGSQHRGVDKAQSALGGDRSIYVAISSTPSIFYDKQSPRYLLLPLEKLCCCRKNISYIPSLCCCPHIPLPVHDVDAGSGKNLSRKIMINCVLWNKID